MYPHESIDWRTPAPQGIPQEQIGVPIENVLIPKAGEDIWAWEGRCSLLLTSVGAFVLHRESFYRYARPATAADFRTAFGETGSGLSRGLRYISLTLDVLIPKEILLQAWSFLCKAWQQYGTEDILFLSFSWRRKAYELIHPTLTYADASGVGYDTPVIPPGAVAFGTFHSHPRISAFHSDADDADVRGIPGLHVVLGDLDRPFPSIACVLSATSDERYNVHPEDVFGECPVFPLSFELFPPEWLGRPKDLPKDVPPAERGVRKGVDDAS